MNMDDQYDALIQVPSMYPPLLHPVERNDMALQKRYMQWQKILYNRLDGIKALGMSSLLEYNMYVKSIKQQIPSPPTSQVEGSKSLLPGPWAEHL